MSFVVIEGDNGTGKDTLALNIRDKLGYRIIMNESDVKKLNKKAKQYEGKERIEKFLDYGKFCSDIVNETRENVILVRYWISTLAAAYADNIYTYEQTCKLENNICSKFCKPDIIICLWCDFETRVKRIETRKSLDFDDTTRKRNEKYKWFLNKCEAKTNIKWINIDTTNKSRDEIFEEVNKYIMCDNN
jgi:dTMP kinase